LCARALPRALALPLISFFFFLLVLVPQFFLSGALGRLPKKMPRSEKKKKEKKKYEVKKKKKEYEVKKRSTK
jgi:hypothetical protein